MALSFAFEELSETILNAAAVRAAVTTDSKMPEGFELKTRLQVGRVLSESLPENVEPVHLLHTAKSHLRGSGIANG